MLVNPNNLAISINFIRCLFPIYLITNTTITTSRRALNHQLIASLHPHHIPLSKVHRPKRFILELAVPDVRSERARVTASETIRPRCPPLSDDAEAKRRQSLVHSPGSVSVVERALAAASLSDTKLPHEDRVPLLDELCVGYAHVGHVSVHGTRAMPGWPSTCTAADSLAKGIPEAFGAASLVEGLAAEEADAIHASL